MGINLVFGVIFVGVGATLVMDVWAFFLKKVFSVPSLNYCLVGRWFGHMPSGRFTHQNIVHSDPKPLECQLGWLSHYAIGVVFAAVLVAIMSPAWLGEPTILAALMFGVATVIVPFVVMQPSFGLGIAASKSPYPVQARVRSVLAHASFGVGLYFSALAVGFMWPVHV